MYLSVTHDLINTPHNGTSGYRYGGGSQPVRIQPSENGLFEMPGFSPIKYYCRVTAPGYLEKLIPVEFSEWQALDIGTVKLEIPKQIQLSYVVSSEPPFAMNTLQNVTIPAGTRWKAEDNEKNYGWDLEFAQEKGAIIMRYSYAPCYLRDLGPGEIADFVNVDKKMIGTQQPQNLRAKNGHVYL